MKFLLVLLGLLPMVGGAAISASKELALSLVPSLPSDLPLNGQGIPTRPLDDAELHRLLLALTATNEAATLRLARCHAEGQPYGAAGWRACVMRAP